MALLAGLASPVDEKKSAKCSVSRGQSHRSGGLSEWSWVWVLESLRVGRVVARDAPLLASRAPPVDVA